MKRENRIKSTVHDLDNCHSSSRTSLDTIPKIVDRVVNIKLNLT